MSISAQEVLRFLDIEAVVSDEELLTEDEDDDLGAFVRLALVPF